MNAKIAVLGAGAIGGSVGADLVRAGHDVCLIDQWPAHVEAMKEKGLRVAIDNDEECVPVRAFHLCDASNLREHFDVVLLAVKSNDTLWMTQFAKPLLAQGGVLVSLQNSLNEEWIAPVIGSERTVGCAVTLAAEVSAPGEIRRDTTHKGTWFTLGELDGKTTPRLRQLQGLLGAAGNVSLTENLWGAKWSKLVTSSMVIAPPAMLGLGPYEASTLPGMYDVLLAIGKETVEVGMAHGYAIEGIFGLDNRALAGSVESSVAQLLATILAHARASPRNGMLHDHLCGRNSEVEFLNGLVVRKGREAGISTHMNEAVTAITRRIESGLLRPDRSNLRLITEGGTSRESARV